MRARLADPRSLARNNFLRKVELHLGDWLFSVRKREKRILRRVAVGRGADVGCGSAKVSRACIGVDIVPGGRRGKFGSERNRLSAADIACAGDDLGVFADGELDFVVACHNLEHYRDPLRAVTEWRRVLRPGGRIGVVVPDDRYVDSIALDPTHRVSFTPAKLEALFRRAGLRVIATGVAIRHWSIYLVAEKPDG